MGRAYSLDLRERVIARIEAGATRTAAAHFDKRSERDPLAAAQAGHRPDRVQADGWDAKAVVGGASRMASGRDSARSDMIFVGERRPAGREDAGAMSNKPTKTRDELAALINEWLKSHPECGNVTGVAIANVVRIADDRHNWHAAFTMADGAAVPAMALHIIGELSAKFDLA